MPLPSLPTNKAAMEKAVREAIRGKFVPLLSEEVAHDRERAVDSVAEYLRLLALKGADGKTRLRGVMVKFKGFEPMLEDASGVDCIPIKLRYEIEAIFGFEDKRADGGNSTDDFNGFVMNAFEAFRIDQELGYSGLSHNLLSMPDNAGVEPFDDKVLCHVGNLELECEVTC